MSSLPDLAEALCRAVASHDQDYALRVCEQIAAKLPEPRASRIRNAIKFANPITLSKVKHWAPVNERRSPWVPEGVRSDIKRWMAEISHATALIENGERPLPLLLTGETRCGKTSTLAVLAAEMGLPVMRFSIADGMGSHLGESAQSIRDAFKEVRAESKCVWLIDEMDAVASQRDDGKQACSREMNSAIGALLTEIEAVPPETLLVATSNLSKNIDAAVRARFAVVDFPRWEDMPADDRIAFAASHGGDVATVGASYAETVQACRRARVDAILARMEPVT